MISKKPQPIEVVISIRNLSTGKVTERFNVCPGGFVLDETVIQADKLGDHILSKLPHFTPTT